MTSTPTRRASPPRSGPRTRIDKHVEATVGGARLAAQCKGAGMISPRFATMLCFVQTDAALTAEQADRLLGAAVARSFDRISVDGQLSTNDTVILMASGINEVDEAEFAAALDAMLRDLAKRIVRDGEGARRIGCVRVRGGGPQDAERVARAVANSPLVKAALFGGDPNWGRIAQAVGAALPGTAPLAFGIAIEGVTVARDGAAVPYDRAALIEAVSGEEVVYEVSLPGEGARGRGALLRPLLRLREDQRGVHDVSEAH